VMQRTIATILSTAVLALLPLAGVCPEDTSLEYPLYQLTAAPTLDGNIDSDPAWQGVPEATGFFKLGGDYTRGKQTQVRAAWKGDTVYIAVRCEEPDIRNITPQLRDGDDLWTEDGIEIFVRPEGLAGFHQFIVNSGGFRRGEGISKGSLNWRVAAARGPELYTLEIALPVSLFGEMPIAGDVWRGNFCRNIFTDISGGDKFTTWAPLRASFHEWERFARWKFCMESPDPKATLAVEARLNGVYRQFLRDEIERMSRLADTYVPALQRAAKTGPFAEDARRLLEGWAQGTRMKELGPLAPSVEIRRAVALGEHLVERSHTLKYRFLMGELFNGS